MFEKQGLKKFSKQPRKSRKNQDWDYVPKRERERPISERKESRRSPRKFRDEDEMDWRDILMEEGNEDKHDR
jgi:hypothetical protein